MPLITFDMAVTHALRESGIIPSSKSDEVDLGNHIPPLHCKYQPKIEIYSGDTINRNTYTMMMIDPDAPSRDDPKYRYYRHWVLAGIPASSDLSHASVKASYLSPTPPKGSGDHRYLFLLYKQPNATVSFAPLENERGGWDYTNYVKHSNLELVGANFFLSRKE
ncbi:PEBP-like protein, partial [Backusella circina FSU 941]